MKKLLIGGILHNHNYTMLKVVGLQNKPGHAGKIFTEFGRANINLHFIAESEDSYGMGNMTICVNPENAKEAIS